MDETRFAVITVKRGGLLDWMTTWQGEVTGANEFERFQFAETKIGVRAAMLFCSIKNSTPMQGK